MKKDLKNKDTSSLTNHCISQVNTKHMEKGSSAREFGKYVFFSILTELNHSHTHHESC